MPSLSEWKIFLHTRRNLLMKLIAVLSVVCVIHINAVHTARKAQDTYEAYLNQAVNIFTYASSVQKAALEMNTLLASSADDAVTFSYAYYDQNEKKTIFCTNALFSDDGTFVADIDRIIPGSVLNRMMIYHWSAVQESSGYLMLAGFSDEEQLVAAGCMHVIDSELRSLSANDLVARMNADDREIIPVFFQQWEAAESVHWRKVQCLFPYLDPNSRSLWRKWNYDTALQEAVKVFVSQPTLMYPAMENDVRTAASEIHTVDGHTGILFTACHQHTFYLLMHTLAVLALAALLVIAIAYPWYSFRSTSRNERQQAEELRRDFMNALAHELRTPLAAMMGYAENLRLGVREEKRDYYLNQILAKGNQMNRMIDDMLSLARLDDAALCLVKEELCINDILREVVNEDDLDPDIAEEDRMYVSADREYLIRILKILLDNAFRYRQEATAVTVRIQADALAIHNTCFPLSDRCLKEIFTFRRNPDGHYSYGLCFAKKAAVKNGLQLKLYNDDDGVTVLLHR